MVDTTVPAPDETYYGYCVGCGAAHEVGGELDAAERGCMCGGQIVKADILAQLAHRLWTHWSQAIAEAEDISDERVERWRHFWVPYEELSIEEQEKDQHLVEEFLSETPEYEQ